MEKKIRGDLRFFTTIEDPAFIVVPDEPQQVPDSDLLDPERESRIKKREFAQDIRAFESKQKAKFKDRR